MLIYQIIGEFVTKRTHNKLNLATTKTKQTNYVWFTIPNFLFTKPNFHIKAHFSKKKKKKLNTKTFFGSFFLKCNKNVDENI